MPPQIPHAAFSTHPQAWQPRTCYLPYGSPFSRMSDKWNHTARASEAGFVHLARCLFTAEYISSCRCAREMWDVEVCLSNFPGEGP